MMYFAKSLNDNNLDYDVISCLNQLNEIAETYNKKIFIAETQYPFKETIWTIIQIKHQIMTIIYFIL